MINFTNILYLKRGNSRQQHAYNLLSEYCIFEKLANYQPLLAGTIPINIDLPTSDLDIICYWKNKEQFKTLLQKEFKQHPKFVLKETLNRNHETIIARFQLEYFPIEIFGQNRPSATQEAFRHMLIEHALLEKYGEGFRKQIIQLKNQGYKTEPAFAQLLGITGNPYDELLKLYGE